MSETHLQVTATVPAPPAKVFDLLASPYRHKEVDASGTVGDDEFDEPITKVGQVFRMNMSWTDPQGEVTRYQTDNHVTKFKANRKIAWAVATADGPRLGWFWRYDLAPKGKHDQKTLVTLTYDWADASDANREQYGVPSYSAEDLQQSLKLLETAFRD